MSRVCILTFQNALNYGALLQAYALQQKLLDLGVTVDILNYNNRIFYDKYVVNESAMHCKSIKRKIKLVAKWILKPQVMLRYKRKRESLLTFINNKLILSEYCDRNAINDVCQEYDKIIVGSDQVWNFGLTDFDTTYLLDFLSDSNSNKKHTYAASFGNVNFGEKEMQLYSKYLPGFDSILIRERSGQKFLMDNFRLDSTVVVDPTLLLKKEVWYDFCKDFKRDKKIHRRYILIYLIGQHTNLIKEAVKLAKQEDMHIVTLSAIDIDFPAINVEGSSLEEFVGYIKNAEYVFTTSFHGLIFSINLNTNFYYELSREKINNNSRLIDIADELGLVDREITEQPLCSTKINWDIVNHKLDLLRENSIKALCNDLG